MPHQDSLRVLLGKALVICAVDPLESKARCQMLHDDAVFFGVYDGAGTPATPLETGYLRPSRYVHDRIVGDFETNERASFDEDEASWHKHQAIAGTGSVHVSPTEAFMQLSSDRTESPSSEEGAVMDLALELIKIAEDENHLAGYSAFCVAATCTFAAETALDAHIELVEVQTPQIIYSACDKLQASMSTSLRAIWAVLDAKGDPNTFPGRPVASEGSALEHQVRSLRSRRVEEMVERGGSSLRAIASAAELPDTLPELGAPLRRFGRYYAAAEEDEVSVDFEEGSYEGEACHGESYDGFTWDQSSSEEGVEEKESIGQESCNGESSRNECDNILAFPDFRSAFTHSEAAASWSWRGLDVEGSH